MLINRVRCPLALAQRTPKLSRRLSPRPKFTADQRLLKFVPVLIAHAGVSPAGDMWIGATRISTEVSRGNQHPCDPPSLYLSTPR